MVDGVLTKLEPRKHLDLSFRKMVLVGIYEAIMPRVEDTNQREVSQSITCLMEESDSCVQLQTIEESNPRMQQLYSNHHYTPPVSISHSKSEQLK